MTLDYFYGQSGELFAYFRIPKALFQDSRFRQLSTDARTLYGILLDRMSLSAKNSWVDEHGRVYIIYTVREVQESLCCAEHKAVKLFRELEQADLIERKRRGLGRPSLIYVKNFSSGLPKAQIWIVMLISKPLMLFDNQSSITEDDYIVLSPYSASGMEFKAVVLLGVDEGRIPQTSGTSDISQNFTRYAAYNLLYLTASRAKWGLTLLSSKVNGRSSCLDHVIEAGYLECNE